MGKNKNLQDPSQEAEKELRDIVRNEKTSIEVRGTKFNIGGIYNDTLDWITDILTYEKDDKRITAKCAAAAWLNGYFRLRLFWWAVWRWFYYVKQYTDTELQPIIAECKKKADSDQFMYYLNIISLTDVKTTAMTRTMKEAKPILPELRGALAGAAQSARKAASSSRT